MHVEDNYNKAVDFVRSAASQGAQLVVFPEYFLANWVPNDPKFIGVAARWKTYLENFQALAKECNVCIVPGTIVQHMPGEQEEDDDLFNMAYFIDNQGEILGNYQKKNLWYNSVSRQDGSKMLNTSFKASRTSPSDLKRPRTP